jgi:hypothetical protein
LTAATPWLRHSPEGTAQPGTAWLGLPRNANRHKTGHRVTSKPVSVQPQSCSDIRRAKSHPAQHAGRAERQDVCLGNYEAQEQSSLTTSNDAACKLRHCCRTHVQTRICDFCRDSLPLKMRRAKQTGVLLYRASQCTGLSVSRQLQKPSILNSSLSNRFLATKTSTSKAKTGSTKTGAHRSLSSSQIVNVVAIHRANPRKRVVVLVSVLLRRVLSLFC